MVVFAFPLIRRARAAPLQRRVPRISTIVIFVVSAVVLLCMSAVFHLLTPGTPGREVLQRLDHAAIFVLIAGTFTPIHGILFKGPWRWGMLAMIWIVGAAGVALKSVFFTQTPETLGTVLYISMGLLAVPAVVALGRRFSVRFVLPIVLGGVAYIAGAVVDLALLQPLIPGVVRAHEVFHILILVGLGFHADFIWRIADAPAAPMPREWHRTPRAERGAGVGARAGLNGSGGR
jgi:channel protein (hemolysin III family)